MPSSPRKGRDDYSTTMLPRTKIFRYLCHVTKV